MGSEPCEKMCNKSNLECDTEGHWYANETIINMISSCKSREAKNGPILQAHSGCYEYSNVELLKCDDDIYLYDDHHICYCTFPGMHLNGHSPVCMSCTELCIVTPSQFI